MSRLDVGQLTTRYLCSIVRDDKSKFRVYQTGYSERAIETTTMAMAERIAYLMNLEVRLNEFILENTNFYDDCQ